MRTLTRRRFVAMAAAAAIAVGGFVSAVAAPAYAAFTSSLGGSISRAEVIERAQYWVDHQPGPYDFTGSGWRAPDPINSRGYRRDCSGLVDMAWHLNSDQSTHYLYQVADEISRSDLKPGDVLNSPAEHVILFAGWEAADHVYFSYYTFGSAPVKKLRASINQSSLDGHPNANYRAMRYRNIVDDAGAARIGVVNAASSAVVKEGGLGAPWVNEYDGAAQVVLSGTRIGVLTSDGRVQVKDGDLGAGWVTLTTGATQVALSGTRIAVLTTDGRVLVKDGGLGAGWVTLSTGATQVALSGSRIGVLYADGHVAVKEGDLGAGWVTLTTGASRVVLSGARIGVLTTDGRVLVKDGGLGAGWVTLSTGATQVALSGSRIGVLYADGHVAVKEGDLGAGWVTLTTGAARVVLSGARIGVLTTDGRAVIKEGDLGAGWVTVANGVTQLALSTP